MRRVPEWVGKTDDAKIPDRVRLRVFLDHEGYCWLSKRKIAAGELWDLDHKVALINGGEHRESNLAPALRDKHRAKTTEDVAEKSAVYRKAAKHNGIRPRSRLQSAGFPRSEPQRSATRKVEKIVPRRIET